MHGTISCSVAESVTPGGVDHLVIVCIVFWVRDRIFIDLQLFWWWIPMMKLRKGKLIARFAL